MITIGRFGLDIGVQSMKSWDDSGDTVQVSGLVPVESVADGNTLRAQLVALANNPDEPVVPVTWGADSTLDGFYRVNSATATMVGASLAHGMYHVDLQLQRIASSSAPLVEGHALFVEREDVDVFHWSGVPTSTFGWSVNTTPYLTDPLEGGRGDVRIWSLSEGSSRVSWGVTPDSWYDGAATITDASGNAVVGRQAPQVTGGLRIDNGLLRVSTLKASGGPVIKVERWDGTAWGTGHLFRVFGYSPSPGPGVTDVDGDISATTIVLNSPEAVTIQVACTTSGASSGDHLIARSFFVTLRRGALMCEVGWDLSTGGLAYAGSGSASTVTGYTTHAIQGAADDADGNRWVLAGAGPAHSVDAANKRIYGTTASTGRLTFGLGVTTNSTAPSPAQIVGLWMSAGSEQVRVVGR